MSLHDDILHMIFSLLGAWDLFNAAQVCTRWRRVAISDSIWATFPGGAQIKSLISTGSHGETKHHVIRPIWVKRFFPHLCPVCEVNQRACTAWTTETLCSVCILDVVAVATLRCRLAVESLHKAQQRVAQARADMSKHGFTMWAPRRMSKEPVHTLMHFLNSMVYDYIADDDEFVDNPFSSQNLADEAVYMVEAKWLLDADPNFEVSYMKHFSQLWTVGYGGRCAGNGGIAYDRARFDTATNLFGRVVPQDIEKFMSGIPTGTQLSAMCHCFFLLGDHDMAQFSY